MINIILYVYKIIKLKKILINSNIITNYCKIQYLIKKKINNYQINFLQLD